MSAFLPIASNIDVNARVYDNVYQTNSNMLESVARVINSRSTKLSLNSKAFGNVVQVNIPRGNMLLGHTSVSLKINKSAVPTNAFLTQDWVYDAIRYVEFQFGNSEKLRYEGKHLLIKNLADCESGEKKDIMQNYAGDQKIDKASGELLRREEYVGSATIYLPFSNMSSARCLPFDASVLQAPVQLTIELAPADQVFKYTAADAAVVRAALPNDYTDAYVSCKTQYFVDGPSDSIRDVVSMRGDQKYSYGYIYPQTFMDSKDIVGVPASEKVGGMSVEMTRFLNAGLQSIDIFVERITLGNAAGSPAGAVADEPLSNSVQPRNNYVPISNVQLLYAGQPIYRSDDNSNILENLSEYPTSTTFDLEAWDFKKTTAPTLTNGNAPKTGYWTHIQLSQYNERYFTNLVQSGVALNSNEVLLTFNTPERQDLPSMIDGVSETAVQPKYRLHAIYNYHRNPRNFLA